MLANFRGNRGQRWAFRLGFPIVDGFTASVWCATSVRVRGSGSGFDIERRRSWQAGELA
jgi:hypothetical protein